jgi:lysozyme family protein
MKGNWNKAINLVLANEGGYINNPKDPGGETNFGISKRSYPSEDIKNMTKERATQIYKQNYWDKVKGDQLSNKLDIAVFDCAVNSGVGTASKILQKVVGATPDGVIGPKTLAAIDATVNVYSKFLFAWVKNYFSIVNSKPTQMIFLNGWINRVLKIVLGS